jgi:hypothetical protein
MKLTRAATSRRLGSPFGLRQGAHVRGQLDAHDLLPFLGQRKRDPTGSGAQVEDRAADCRPQRPVHVDVAGQLALDRSLGPGVVGFDVEPGRPVERGLAHPASAARRSTCSATIRRWIWFVPS